MILRSAIIACGLVFIGCMAGVIYGSLEGKVTAAAFLVGSIIVAVQLVQMLQKEGSTPASPALAWTGAVLVNIGAASYAFGILAGGFAIILRMPFSTFAHVWWSLGIGIALLMTALLIWWRTA